MAFINPAKTDFKKLSSGLKRNTHPNQIQEIKDREKEPKAKWYDLPGSIIPGKALVNYGNKKQKST